MLSRTPLALPSLAKDLSWQDALIGFLSYR